MVERVAEIAAEAVEKDAQRPRCPKCGVASVWGSDSRCWDCSQLCRACDDEPGDLRHAFIGPRCRAQRALDIGLPPRLRSATTDALRTGQPAAICAAVGRFHREQLTGLVLVGPAGTGKSFTAAALVRQAVDANPATTWRFVTVVDLLDDLKPDRAHLGHYTEPTLLVLDDVGRERLATDWARETLFAVVDARWRNGRRTIVTSNFEPDALKVRLGEALVDRLIDGAVGVRFTGSSKRGMVA